MLNRNEIDLFLIDYTIVDNHSTNTDYGNRNLLPLSRYRRRDRIAPMGLPSNSIL